jgi:ketosteroid isomerase-like protein
MHVVRPTTITAAGTPAGHLDHAGSDMAVSDTSVMSPKEFDEHFAKAFTSGDLDGLLALFERGATFLAQPGSPASGSDAIRETLAYFSSLNGQFELRTGSVVETDDVALVLSDWSLRGGTDPDGNSVDLSGQSSLVLRKQDDGGWLCVIDDPWSAR